MNDKTLTELILELDNHIHFTWTNRYLKRSRGRGFSFGAWNKMLCKLLRFAGTKRALDVVKATYER